MSLSDVLPSLYPCHYEQWLVGMGVGGACCQLQNDGLLTRVDCKLETRGWEVKIRGWGRKRVRGFEMCGWGSKYVGWGLKWVETGLQGFENGCWGSKWNARKWVVQKVCG